MSPVLHAVPSGLATASASEDSPLLARSPQRDRTNGGNVEARLEAAMQGQTRLRAENARLLRSLEAASRRAATAQRIARHDGLTGLPNRLFLIERIGHVGFTSVTLGNAWTVWRAVDALLAERR